MKNLYLYFFLILLFCACEREKSSDFPFDSLNPTTSGIHFSNNLVDTDSFNIMQYLYYYNGGGVAAGDLNNDGKVDLFYTGNQVNDALYINKGNLSFEDVSESSGINLHNGWSTGVTMLDINSDGWLDIYVCRLGKYKIYDDHNRLYINNQDGTFSESARRYGLDFSGFSTQAAFFDADLDGDLDCYLLNHSVKRPDQFVKADRIRNEIDSLAGDRFYENIDGNFKDKTEASGIYSSNVGFGLSICIADMNNDYYPDIYVGNDFHENDYLYLNNQDGTFKEVIKDAVGHTSNFTMGSTIQDINNDGQLDILSLDMLPKKEEIFKQSGGWESKQIYDFKRDYGYHHQSPKNALQINIGQIEDTPIYSEQAALYGLHASDWSWTPLISDFDLDNDKDIYITNGIYKRPNDMDFVNYYSDPQNGNKSDLEMINKMPSGLISNQYYVQDSNQFFEIETGKPTISNGACTADLDNDGDLDLIINNLNEKSTLLINNTNPVDYLKLKIDGSDVNRLVKNGLKVMTADKNGAQSHSLFAGNGGFQSMNESIIILPKQKSDSNVKVFLPDGNFRTLKINPDSNTYTLDNSFINSIETEKESYKYPALPIDSLTLHIENEFNDQNKEPLLLYNLSQNGPRITQNKKGNIYITQAKGNNGSIINPKTKNLITTINKGSDTRFVDETDAVFFDADGDGDEDLYICLGGNELPDGDLSLPDALFINENSDYKRNTKMLPKIPKNTSTVSAADYDNDGDTDLFVGVQSRAGDYGIPDASYILQNMENRRFKALRIDIEAMVYDSEWRDIDGDGRSDLVIVGHWMPITILFNKEQGFEKYEIPNSEGWWYSLYIDDFDKDGKLDIMAGNFGENHRLSVNLKSPLKMYINDYDKNGKIDPIITYHVEGKEYPYANLDLLLKQIPSKRKQSILHTEFAQKSITDIFTPEELKTSSVKYTNTLSSSMFFQNEINDWEIKPLPQKIQLAPIWAIESYQGNYVVGGNHFDIDPNLGRQDALPLSFIEFVGRDISVIRDNKLPNIMEEVRSLLSLDQSLIIGVNDGTVLKF